MITPSTRRMATKGVAAVAAAASLGSLFVTSSQPVGADPAPVLVGVGSDTTQDVMNALAGFNNGIGYVPLRSSAASKNTQLASYDAILGAKGTCITPKPGPTFSRPNGSSNGRRALSRSLDGANWAVGSSTCPGEPTGQAIGGLVDFARSSAGPNPEDPNVVPSLTYLPFGRDALSFAYYRPAGAPVTTLTSAQLQDIFKIGPQTIGGVKIVGCSIQSGSGTFQSWNTALGASTTQMSTATTQCRTVPGVVAPGELQENDGNGLKTRGDLVAAQPGEANTQVVIGYSAANFIAQKNGVSPNQTSSAPTLDLGAIDALGKPYRSNGTTLIACGTGGTCVSDFYANATYGRTVYNVVDTDRIGGAPSSNADLKTLLVGPTSAICGAAAQTTISAFGFSPASLPTTGSGSCGDRSIRGAYLTGNGSL